MALDCKAYYRIVGRQRRELWRNAVFLEDGVQLDERCVASEMPLRLLSALGYLM